MQPKWVTIATFNMPYQAHLAKSRLEAGGIPVLILDEHLVRMMPFLSQALGEVKLQVPDVHLEEAREILDFTADVELSDEEALSATLPEEPAPEPPELMECPHCGGRGFVEEVNHPVERFLNGLLLGLPFLWLGRPLLCRACRHAFREQ